jgi:2-methylcitrate synthase
MTSVKMRAGSRRRPNHQELADFKKRLKGLRSLPNALKEVLERIPKDAHPMDVLRTGTSMLGVLESERDFTEQDAIAERLPSNTDIL